MQASGFDEQTARRTVARLDEQDLVSDWRFAEAFVRSRVGQGYGPLRIRAELRQRGVAEALWERASAEIDVPWDELLCEVCGRKYGPQAPADHRERARRFRFLQHRGFSAAAIRAVVGEPVDSD